MHFWAQIFLMTSCLLILSAGQTTTENSGSSSTDSTTPVVPKCPEFCSLSYEKGGRGKAPFRMWYFDLEEKECKTFRYTGRNGNKNRFRKKQDCESTCKTCAHAVDSSEEEGDLLKSDVCKLPYSQGNVCNNDTTSPNFSKLTIMWRFSPDSQSCLPFAYLGCGGNDNKFDTSSDCEASCI